MSWELGSKWTRYNGFYSAFTDTRVLSAHFLLTSTGHWGSSQGYHKEKDAWKRMRLCDGRAYTIEPKKSPLGTQRGQECRGLGAICSKTRQHEMLNRTKFEFLEMKTHHRKAFFDMLSRWGWWLSLSPVVKTTREERHLHVDFSFNTSQTCALESCERDAIWKLI